MIDRSQVNETSTTLPGLMESFRVVRERWMLGGACGVFLAGVFSLYILSRTPEYTSSLQLLVDVSQDNVVDIEQVVDEAELSRSSKAESLLKHHLIEMRSRVFSEYVVSSFDDSETELILGPYRSPELSEPDIGGLVRNSIRVSLNSMDMLYVISCTHRDPEAAAFIANRYAERYVEYVLSDVGSSNASALIFLRKNADKLRESIQQDLRKLQEFREKLGIISIEDSRGIAIDKIVDLNAKRLNFTVEKEGYETILAQLKARQIEPNQLDDGKIALALEIGEISSFGNVSDIKGELEKERAREKEIALVYLNRHPVYIENKERIRELESRLKDEISLAINSLISSIDKLDSQIKLNLSNVAALEEETQKLDEADIVYNGIELKIERDQSTLNRIEERLNETLISSQLSKANMRVIDAAVKPYAASYPNRERSMMTAVFLFGLGFVGLPIILNFIDDKLKSPYDVEEYLGKPLLGDITFVTKEFRDRMHELVSSGLDTIMVDTFRAIYNSIKLNSLNADRMIQVVSSTIPDEGKTVFSLNYAAISAQHGNRVLLIDCDLRKPQVQKIVSLKVESGLVGWFNDGAKLEKGADLIELLGILKLDSGVYLLPAGKATNRSTELIENPAFEKLIARLSDEFDHIIIDTPPLGVFPDAMFLAEHAQDVIYVSRFNMVSRSKVRHFIGQLDQTSAKVRGVVINGRKRNRFGRDSYNYDYGYNYSYASKYYKKYYSNADQDNQ